MSEHPNNVAASPARRRALIGTLLAVVLSTLGIATGASIVSAHTSFAGSTPANGSTVAEPVSEILIEFTNPSTEAGDGFVVLDPTGQIRTPSTVTTDDGRVFRLGFEPALAGGEVGVRWSVRAGDAHPIEGSFAFTVTAAATTEQPTTSTEPSAATTVAEAAPETSPTTEGEAVTNAPDDMSSMSAAEMSTMDEFLQVDQSTPGESLARLGRLISFAAIVLGIGALAFAATTLRGSLEEIGSLIAAVRILGGVLVVGALAEYVGVARIGNESLGAAWTSSAGAATALRAVAGVAIAVGLVATTVPIRQRARSLSAAVTSPHAGLDVDDADRPSADDDNDRPVVRRWVPDRSSRLAFVGIGLAIISFWFDGHTVTKGFRVLHALANTIHVVAGSIWVGGVVTMAVVMWSRHRRSRPTDALGLVVRFSAVASVALGAVVVAGLVMAVAILDSFGELTSTQWGQTFLLKSAVAGLAMVAGAYNHFRLMPALERDPDDEVVHRSVRSTVTAEAILLGFVIVVTAWLVAAAS
ncbi:MAG: CopD family protein [Ilumatobacteraceae bacterium]